MRKIALTVLLMVSAWMTAQQYYFTLSVKQPARCPIALPERVVLLNYSMVQPEQMGHQTMVPGAESASSVQVDLSQAAEFCLFGLRQQLEETDPTLEINLVEQSLRKSGSFFTRETLSQEKVDSLCEYYQSEAVLSLRQITLYDMEEVYLTDAQDYYAYLQAYAASLWTIQYAHRAHPAEHFQSRDTLFWNAREADMGSALVALPERKEALLHAAFRAGQRLGEEFFPTWQSAERYLYSAPELEPGIAHFRRQHWAEAIQAWEQVYTHLRQPLLKAYAAADMAVAYEVMEEYDAARLWAQRAVSLLKKLPTAQGAQQAANMQYYLSLLKERK